MNIIQQRYTGKDHSVVKWQGVVTMPKHDLARVLRRPDDFIDGWNVGEEDGKLILLPRPNLVVQVGVARSLDRLFQISGGSGVSPLNSLTQEVVRIGVDNGTTNPTATSVSSNTGGGTDTGASTQTLRTFNSAATRASLVVSATGTFNDPTTGGIGAVSYAMKRLFFSAHTANITNTTAADTDGTLYSMTNVFTVDFTGIATWSANFTGTVTGAGT
ncbi:hypothetical protein [Sphingomonas sp.]|jgi:hypothetical protein|uniref:hypothetical protein n=1 Tax=Sphingomonas sp. TaxID=28214 RepID=UPI0035613F66